jgi:hypothetical protein
MSSPSMWTRSTLPLNFLRQLAQFIDSKGEMSCFYSLEYRTMEFCRICVSLLYLRDFNAIDSFLVILDFKGLDFSNIHRILQWITIPKFGGNVDPEHSDEHAMYKLDTLFVTAKLRPLLIIDPSDSVRTCSDNFRTNFSYFYLVLGVALIWWATNFRIWISFCLRKLCLKEFSTAARMRSCSDWLVDLRKEDSRLLICLFSASFLKRRNWIISLIRALLALKFVLEEREF